VLEVYCEGRQRQATPEDERVAHALGLGRAPRTHEHANNAGYYFEDDAMYFARVGITE
jgi:hypothetical protein